MKVLSKSNSQGVKNTNVFLISLPLVMLAYHLFPSFPGRGVFPAFVPIVLLTSVLWRRSSFESAFNSLGMKFFLLYLVFAITGVVGVHQVDYFVLRKALLPAIGLSILAFRFEISTKAIVGLSILMFLVGLLFAGLITGTSSKTNLGSVLSSNWTTESVYGVALGGVVVVLLSRHRLGLALLILVLVVILAKRNSILASAVLLVGYVPLWKVFGEQKAFYVLRLLLPLLAIAMFLLLWNITSVFEHVASTFSGVTAEMISTGRHILYDSIIQVATMAPFSQILFGHGTGEVERFIANQSYINSNIDLAHSEYLSLLYDYGLFGVVMFFGFLLRIAWVSRDNTLLVAFMLIIAAVENYLMISFVMMTFSFLLAGGFPPKAPPKEFVL